MVPETVQKCKRCKQQYIPTGEHGSYSLCPPCKAKTATDNVKEKIAEIYKIEIEKQRRL